MIDFTNITIIVCQYNTSYLIEPFLKSFVHYHPEIEKFIFLASDNSTNEESQRIFKKNNITSLRNPGLTHNPAVDILFEKVKTKYALLCDSDILIQKPLFDLFDLFFKNDLTSMGEIQGDRGGYRFVCPRVAPYWNLINLDNIKAKNIKFHDPERVKKSGSEGFFKNIPLQRNEGNFYYDTSTTFFQDITANNLKIGKINGKIKEYVYHAEGMSWRKDTNIDGYIKMDCLIKNQYMEKIKIFDTCEIKNKFI
jgi:hypothetical protein